MPSQQPLERRERLLDEMWAWEHRITIRHSLGKQYLIFYVPSRKTQPYTLAKVHRRNDTHTSYQALYSTLRFGETPEALEASVNV